MESYKIISAWAHFEALGSFLPGIQIGPAATYQRILTAAEVTRQGHQQLDVMALTRPARADFMSLMDAHNRTLGVQIGFQANSREELVVQVRNLMRTGVPIEARDDITFPDRPVWPDLPLWELQPVDPQTHRSLSFEECNVEMIWPDNGAPCPFVHRWWDEVQERQKIREQRPRIGIESIENGAIIHFSNNRQLRVFDHEFAYTLLDGEQAVVLEKKLADGRLWVRVLNISGVVTEEIFRGEPSRFGVLQDGMQQMIENKKYTFYMHKGWFGIDGQFYASSEDLAKEYFTQDIDGSDLQVLQNQQALFGQYFEQTNLDGLLNVLVHSHQEFCAWSRRLFELLPQQEKYEFAIEVNQFCASIFTEPVFEGLELAQLENTYREAPSSFSYLFNKAKKENFAHIANIFAVETAQSELTPQDFSNEISFDENTNFDTNLKTNDDLDQTSLDVASDFLSDDEDYFANTNSHTSPTQEAINWLEANVNLNQSGIILFAHGSRDVRWREPFDRLINAFGEILPNIHLQLAFLEFMEPTLADATESLAALGCADIYVIPLFLGQGGHIRSEFPELMQSLQITNPQLNMHALPTIGESSEVLAAMIDFCIMHIYQQKIQQIS